MTDVSGHGTVSGENLIARHPFPAAGLLALLSLPFHAVLPFWWSHQIAALVLAAIAGIYLGFAVLDGSTTRLIREAIAALAFIGIAASAIIYNPLWLPVGYIAHGIWDWLHHLPPFKLKMPNWYIPFCAAYDILAGVGIWLIWTLQ